MVRWHHTFKGEFILNNVKVLPTEFKKIVRGDLTLDLKEKEFQFKLGEDLILKEYDHGMYTGREVTKRIAYITDCVYDTSESTLVFV